VRRTETRSTLQNGVPQLAGFGNDLKARSLRTAAYVQDEWSLNPKWALHGGLRWEGIETDGDAAQPGLPRPSNRSSVWTPLAHVLFKPDPAKRDQVRLSLTRSYRSPALASLIARPVVNNRFPVGLANDPTAPDTVGNPGLRPELATGIDLAFERYLEGGGVLSVNLFHRRITDLTRNVVALETVSWSPVPRWVSRPQNIGQATTQGIELEARFRLDQLIDDAPRVEVRSNLSLFRSRVDGIPGPDNRLDQQAPGTANIGADYRVRGTKFTLGGNLNLVPGFRTQQAADRATETNRRRVADAYVLYAINPATALRFTASNLAPLDTVSRNSVDYRSGGRLLRETSTGTDASHTNWQVRLELKL
jgi:iron complex outermembrane receptor protein